MPYGTQTFPSVASASMHLINGIHAGIRSTLLQVAGYKLTIQTSRFFVILPKTFHIISPIHPDAGSTPALRRAFAEKDFRGHPLVQHP